MSSTNFFTLFRKWLGLNYYEFKYFGLIFQVWSFTPNFLFHFKYWQWQFVRNLSLLIVKKKTFSRVLVTKTFWSMITDYPFFYHHKANDAENNTLRPTKRSKKHINLIRRQISSGSKYFAYDFWVKNFCFSNNQMIRHISNIIQ